MKRNRWGDRITDGLARGVAALAKPIYTQFDNNKRTKRLRQRYKGPRSRRWDMRYQATQFFRTYKLPITGAVVVVLLAGSLTWLATGISMDTAAPGSVEQALAAAEATDLVAEEAAVAPKAMNALEVSLREQVWKAMNIGVVGYDLMINDFDAGYFAQKKEAQQVVDQLIGLYLPIEEDTETDIIRTYFKQDVDVVQTYHPISEIIGSRTPEETLDYIVRGTNEQKRHIVEKGENFWVLAKRFSLDVSDLLKANPDVIPERLQIGQEISLIVPRPLISVYTVEYAEYNDEIAYEIEYEDNAGMYKGEYKTKANGEKGKQFVKAEIYRENGREVGRKILESEVLAEPTTKVVYRGTKNPPPRKGTGSFAKPTSRGYITSGFGWRWGRRHNGIDIGIPIGTDVKAADGGVVVFSGTKGGYGKAIVIDHGANMQTLYAHNSKLHVKVGDKVFKGQIIATSGNTGRSTGPHLHFEIKKNGVPQNPTKYIRY